ncbi:MAG: recombinase family protein [Deltaproteobacteria bacterium]|nr:recombinase family protein [Deltaproteobacteria bacterium]
MSKAKPPSWMGDTNKAIGIIRQSSTGKKAGFSPEIQKAGITEHASRWGLDLVRIVEIHESARRSVDRLKFHRAIDEAADAGIRHLVFHAFDRTSRNLTDHETMQDAACEDDLVIHIACDDRVLHKETSDAEWSMMDHEAVRSKSYSRDRVRRGHENAAEKVKSGWLPSKAPTAYVNLRPRGPDGQVVEGAGTIALTDWGRLLLRRMRELRMRGHALDCIADKVVEEGLAPPHVCARFEHHGKAGRISHMLQNPFYVGQFRWKGEIHAGKHEPAFTHEEWESLQATFVDDHAPPQPTPTQKGALVRLLTCGECGCWISYDPKSKAVKSGEVRTHHYYRCANGRHVHTKLKYVDEEIILGQFAAAVDAIHITDVLAIQIADDLNATHKEVQEQRRREGAKFEHALRELDVKEGKLVDEMFDGGLSRDVAKRQLERIQEERLRLTRQVQAAGEALDDRYLKTAADVLELAKSARSLWESRTPSEKRLLIERLVSNATLDGVTVRYDLKKPFAILGRMAKGTVWLGN